MIFCLQERLRNKKFRRISLNFKIGKFCNKIIFNCLNLKTVNKVFYKLEIFFHKKLYFLIKNEFGHSKNRYNQPKKMTNI